jgi:hypothetical protein
MKFLGREIEFWTFIHCQQYITLSRAVTRFAALKPRADRRATGWVAVRQGGEAAMPDGNQRANG